MAVENGAKAEATADMVIDEIQDDSENMPRKMEKDFSTEVRVGLRIG